MTTYSNPSRAVGLQTFRNTLNANRSTFNDLKHGIVTYNALGGAYNCVFTSCRESVYMGPYGTSGQYLNSKLDLRCNIFSLGTNHWSGTDQIGLFIEPTVVIDNIGGAISPTNSLSRPNSNIWPTAGARPSVKYTQDGVNGWSSPGDWVSISFSGTTNKKYYRFENEFVGNCLLPNSSQFIFSAPNECYMSDNVPNPVLSGQVMVCSNVPSPSGNPYFPLRQGITGLTDYNNQSLKAYPQPCSDYLVIEGMESIDITGHTLIVTNLLGQDFEVDFIAQGQSCTLNTKLLPTGAYYLRLSTGQTFKFLKQ